MTQLYWNTVTPQLRAVLELLMQQELFNGFRLVGGTSLSLQLGHRMSVDIDLFTDQYGSINKAAIDQFLNAHFPYIDTSATDVIGAGISYFIGENEKESIKLDIYYTDSFVHSPLVIDNIRMARREEIIAMKLDIIATAGRKKDFWDIYELLNFFSIPQMLDLYELRYPYNHVRAEVHQKIAYFDEAEDDFDPLCLKGYHWELIKYELNTVVNQR